MRYYPINSAALIVACCFAFTTTVYSRQSEPIRLSPQMDKDKASGPIQPNIPKMISYPCTAMRLISYRLRHSNKTLYLSAMLVILLFLGACGGGGGRPCTGLGVLANPLCTPVKQPKNPSNLSIFDWRGKDLGTQTLRGPGAVVPKLDRI